MLRASSKFGSAGKGEQEGRNANARSRYCSARPTPPHPPAAPPTRPSPPLPVPAPVPGAAERPHATRAQTASGPAPRARKRLMRLTRGAERRGLRVRAGEGPESGVEKKRGRAAKRVEEGKAARTKKKALSRVRSRRVSGERRSAASVAERLRRQRVLMRRARRWREEEPSQRTRAWRLAPAGLGRRAAAGEGVLRRGGGTLPLRR